MRITLGQLTDADSPLLLPSHPAIRFTRNLIGQPSPVSDAGDRTGLLSQMIERGAGRLASLIGSASLTYRWYRVMNYR